MRKKGGGRREGEEGGGGGPSRLDEPDPIVRMSLAFMKFLEKAINDPLWGRLVVRSAQAPAGFDPGVRENLKADLAEAIAQGRLAIQDVELAADIVIGIWLQVTRGSLERRTSPELSRQTLDAVLEPLVPPRHDCQRFSLKVLGPSWNVGYGTPVTRSTAAP